MHLPKVYTACACASFFCMWETEFKLHYLITIAPILLLQSI